MSLPQYQLGVPVPAYAYVPQVWYPAAFGPHAPACQSPYGVPAGAPRVVPSIPRKRKPRAALAGQTGTPLEQRRVLSRSSPLAANVVERVQVCCVAPPRPHYALVAYVLTACDGMTGAIRQAAAEEEEPMEATIEERQPAAEEEVEPMEAALEDQQQVCFASTPIPLAQACQRRAAAAAAAHVAAAHHAGAPGVPPLYPPLRVRMREPPCTALPHFT